jgi:hypothetical protein
LGGASPFSIYKFNINTTDFPVGTIPDTRTDVSNFVESISERTYRFLFDPNYNYFVYSPSIRSDANIPNVGDGQTEWEVITKGKYTAPLYKGNEIQLASDAPQLLATIDKLDELTLKVDTNLDVKVSTRLADADYIDPATPQQVWEYTTRTLTSAGAAGATLAEIEGSLILAMKADVQAVETKVDTKPTLAEMESETSNLAKQDLLSSVFIGIGALDDKIDQANSSLNTIAGNDFDSMNDSLDAISAKVDLKPSLSDIENSTILAKETSVQDVKTKVDTLTNYDDATAQTKLDAIKAKTDTLVNTDLTGIALTTDVTTAKDEVLTAINDIPETDLTGITEDLTIINNGVKKASLLIPHTDSL